MASMRGLKFLFLATAGCQAYKCPSSKSLIHASTKVTVTVQGRCADVKSEMIARVNAQPGNWHDPHNSGTYKIIDSGSDGELETSRTTGAAPHYLDLQTFVFADKGDGCEVMACSASQVTSVADFSTNYCDLRMLYCGSAEGCHPVQHDFKIQETEVSPSFGAWKDASQCIKTTAMQVQEPLVPAAAQTYKCPASKSLIHASTKVTVTVQGSCADVKSEMIARVNAQPGNWHDPHNSGTYKIIDSGNDGELETSRTTAAAPHYLDLQTFVFADKGDGCEVMACSASQVTSVKDFSTNYCDLRMLYCGSAEGCHPVQHDFTIQETEVSPSIGAGKDASQCIKTMTKASIADSVLV